MTDELHIKILNISPIVFKWHTWTERCRQQTQEALEVLKNRGAVAGCQLIDRQRADNVRWIQSLTETEKRDVIDLLLAEADMLFDLMHPSGMKRDEERSTEFRERFYEALTLTNIARHADLLGSSAVMDRFRDIEIEAEQVGWMP